ncbi:MAG TPA: hypothetical protein VI978_02820 [Candidatus Paceibacterota bacterium]
MFCTLSESTDHKERVSSLERNERPEKVLFFSKSKAVDFIKNYATIRF